MLLSIRSGLCRGALSGLIAIMLLIMWLIVFPLITGGEANLEGFIVGANFLALPASLAIVVPDNLPYILRWGMLIILVPLDWALIGGLVMALRNWMLGRWRSSV